MSVLIDFSLLVETVGIDFSNICKWHLHPDRVDAVTKTSTPPGRGYHHGNLRADLIRAATEIISEVGVAHFSIAAAARRTGVSSGAPFGISPIRKALLLAVALHAADHLADRYRAALAESGDPVEQLAAVAGAYVRFARDAGAEFDVIFTAGLEINRHPELRERTRTLMGLLLPLGFALADDAHSALALLEAHSPWPTGTPACCATASSTPAPAIPTTSPATPPTPPEPSYSATAQPTRLGDAVRQRTSKLSWCGRTRREQRHRL